MSEQVMQKRGGLAFWTTMPLWKQIFIALVMGLALGMFLNTTGNGQLAVELKPLGDLFIRGIKMLIVPLVFVSLVSGVTSLHDMSRMGRLSMKAFGLYLATTAVAISLGLALALIFEPGVGVDLGTAKATEAKAATSLVDTLVGLVPTNPVAAFAEGNVLQIIVFAILFGVSINLAGDVGKPVKVFFDASAEVFYKLTAVIIRFAPYGVFALMAWVAGSYGMDVLAPLAKVIAVVYGGCLLHALLVYVGMVRFVARLNPMHYLRGVIEPAIVAFTSTSSAGTLPITMMSAERNLGVSRSVSSFVLPLGATINMDGTALYQGVCALFIAQAYGIDLEAGHYLTIVLTATLASIGTAGVPGAGLIMLSLVLTSIGLPLEGIAIIAGIDRILDMARTSLNVAGDTAVAVVVARSEGELNETTFNSTRVLKSNEVVEAA